MDPLKRHKRDIDRFAAKVDRNGSVPSHCPELGACHVWMAARDIDGYGTFTVANRKQRAHRVAFLLAHGRWPDPCALHRCDNRACVNEAHLFEGTNEENTADRHAKGRSIGAPRGGLNGTRLYPERVRRGERHGNSKLTDELVRSIRSEYAPGRVKQSELAQRHGVAQTLISQVVRGKIWAHVT